jgi:uncharacterized glyoxalase superfamily protein PhnB
MLIPHLHFCGECTQAIFLYETAFNTKAEIVLKNSDESLSTENGEQISHAVMNIHGMKLFLNDRFGNKSRTTDVAVQFIDKFGVQWGFMVKEGAT